MKIEIRATDNWITVIKDCKVVWSTHGCDIDDGLHALGIEYEYEYRDSPDCDDPDDVEAERAFDQWIYAEDLAHESVS